MVHRRWRMLAWVMGLGAIYDLAFGLTILLIPEASSAILRIPLPPDLFYLRLNGVFLLLIAALYALPAWRPERYQAVAPISAGGRVLGCVLFTLAWSEGRPSTFLLLGLADLAIALVTWGSWQAARRVPSK